MHLLAALKGSSGDSAISQQIRKILNSMMAHDPRADSRLLTWMQHLLLDELIDAGSDPVQGFSSKHLAPAARLSCAPSLA